MSNGFLFFSDKSLVGLFELSLCLGGVWGNNRKGDFIAFVVHLEEKGDIRGNRTTNRISKISTLWGLDFIMLRFHLHCNLVRNFYIGICYLRSIDLLRFSEDFFHSSVLLQFGGIELVSEAKMNDAYIYVDISNED